MKKIISQNKTRKAIKEEEFCTISLKKIEVIKIPIQRLEKVNGFLRSQGKPDYIDEITVIKDKETAGNSGVDNEKDELYFKALDIIKTERKASTSFLQRKLQIGYNRAARIMEIMEKEGIVGQANHVGKREIL